MGTFEKVYEVDGERFELYAQLSGSETSYQLVDEDNLTIGASFGYVPDEETVTGVVRAVKALSEPAA
jgi:hypothetical protein